MNNIQHYLSNAEFLKNVLQEHFKPVPCSGVMTLIESINNFKQTNSDKEIYQLLDYPLEKNFKKLVENNYFTEQWRELTEQEKSSLLYISKNIYPMARKKLGLADFNFLFAHLVEIPEVLNKWIDSQSKSTLYKLRKEQIGSDFEEFFGHEKTVSLELEPYDRLARKNYAQYYWNERCAANQYNTWFGCHKNVSKLSIFDQYIYHYFSSMEEGFRANKLVI